MYREFSDGLRTSLPLEQNLPLQEAQISYERAMQALKTAERVRMDLESKLRLTEATASEYLLRGELQKVNFELRRGRILKLADGSGGDAGDAKLPSDGI